MDTGVNMDSNQMMENFRELFSNPSVIFANLIDSVVVILLLLLVRFIALRILNRQVDDAVFRYKWKKYFGYFLGFVGILIVGSIWFEGMASLTTFIGLLSAGLVIALRDPITDMAAWVFILWRKPFAVGDRIELESNKGDVIDIRLFMFSILEIGNWVHADQSTGRVIHIPNHKIFTQSVSNYTSDFDFIWNEIPVVVTFESDWRKAKNVMQEIVDSHLEAFVKDADVQLKRASKSYLIRFNYLTPIVYTEVVDHGIQLTVRHLTNARARRKFTELIWEDILDRFHEEDTIDLAYPTYRMFRNPIEGKPELKPKGSGQSDSE